MSYDTDEILTRLKDRPLKTAEVQNNKERLALTFEDGSVQAFDAHGDCCSHSWIEHLESPWDIEGALITGIEESDGVRDSLDNVCVDGEHYECLKFYRTIFHTTKGDIVVEYRNSSNGYYGGSLDDAGFSDGAQS